MEETEETEETEEMEETEETEEKPKKCVSCGAVNGEFLSENKKDEEIINLKKMVKKLLKELKTSKPEKVENSTVEKKGFIKTFFDLL
jgi:hypothetical protein